MERAAGEEEGKGKGIVEGAAETEMNEGVNRGEENDAEDEKVAKATEIVKRDLDALTGGKEIEEEGENDHGEDVPEKDEKDINAVEEKDVEPDEKEEDECKGQSPQELSSIKVKVNRFDSHDVVDTKMIRSRSLDEVDAKVVNSSSSVSLDETDAKKIKDFFSKHQEDQNRDHGNEVNVSHILVDW